jgi:hypothetical protein
MNSNLNPDERAQRAWIQNDPAAADLAALADLSDAADDAEDRVWCWEHVASRCLDLTDPGSESGSYADRLDEIAALLRRALKGITEFSNE